MSFHEGQRVVCVDDAKPEKFNPLHFPNWVQKDKEYHIRELVHNDDIVTGILLVELKNPLIPIPLVMRFQEGAFADWRFREEKSAYDIKEEESENKLVRVRELDSSGLINHWEFSVTKVL